MLVSKFPLENCDLRVSTGKFGWTFCVFSCVFWWNFGCFRFWLFDQRSTNPADIPFLLTGAEGDSFTEFLSQKNDPFLRSPFYYQNYHVLHVYLNSMTRIFSPANVIHLLANPPLRHFLHHPHLPGSESRFENDSLETSQKKKP